MAAMMATETPTTHSSGVALEAFWQASTLENKSDMKGMEKYTRILSFEYETISPRDAETGMASGKRLHKPIVIQKYTDLSTPLIMDALVTNKKLDKSEIILYGATSKDGKRTQQLKVALTNVFIVRDHVLASPEGSRAIEEVAMTFQKIEITDIPNSKTAADDWNAALA
jgi:type VI secretion system secreted protein Hcp